MRQGQVMIMPDSTDRMKVLERIFERHPELKGEIGAGALTNRISLVKISGEYLMPDRMPSFIEEMADLSLVARLVLVHGSGEPLSQALGYTEKHRGIRITPPEVIPIVVSVATNLTTALVKGINQKGGMAEAVIPSADNPIFYFNKLEQGTDKGITTHFGEVGIVPIGREARCITDVGVELLQSIVYNGFMPVISPIAYKPRTLYNDPMSPLNPDADDIARVITRRLNPNVTVFVTENSSSLGLNLEGVIDYLKSRPPDVIRESSRQDLYRNEDWKIVAAVELAVKGHKIAIVKGKNLAPFLLSSNPVRYSEVVLESSFGIMTMEKGGLPQQPIRFLHHEY